MLALLPVLLHAALQTPVSGARDIVRTATDAVERDSVAAYTTRWQRALADRPTNHSALLGLASVARLTYAYARADTLLARLDGLPLPGDVAAHVALARGLAARDRGQSDSSATFLRLAAERAWQHGDSLTHVQALTELALREAFFSRHAIVDSLLSEAGIRAPVDSELASAWISCARATVWATLGDARAGNEGERGARLAQQAGDARLAVRCTLAATELRVRQGDLDAIRHALRRVAEEAERLRDRTTAGAARAIRGASLLNYSLVGDGTADLRAAVAHGRATQNADRQAMALLNLAQVHYFVGDDDTANQLAREAIPLFDRIRDDGTAAGLSLSLRGSVAESEGRGEDAVNLHERAVTAFRANGRQSGVSFTSGLLAAALAKAGDYESAERVLLEGLSASRMTQRSKTPETLYQLGALALKRQKLREAERLFREGDAAVADDSELRFHFQARLAELRAMRGDVAGAARLLAAASDVLDAWRAAQSEAELRALAFSANRDDMDPDLGFATVLAAMVRAGMVDDAFALAERRRARELLDQVNRGLLVRGETGDGDPVATPRRLGAPPSARDVRRSLPGNTVLIEYVTGTGGEPTSAFVVTPEAVRAVALAPIDSLTTDLVRLNVLLEDNREAGPLVARIRQRLLDPVLAMVPPGVTTALVVPDGALHSVPFPALLSIGGLPSAVAIANVPSAAVALALWQRSAPSRGTAILALGDPMFAPSSGAAGDGDASPYRAAFDARGGLPRLRASSSEVEQVARYSLTPTVLVRGDASEARLKRLALDGYAILHFATHAIVSERAPTRTAIALTAGDGEDGFLGPGEISQLRLDADLVVLSACRTAGGRIVRGEGVQGLTAPLLAAGARAVLASHWPIGDRATARFMTLFYNAVADGQSLGDALRSAQLEAGRQGMPAREWSTFTLVGDPTIHIPLMPSRRLPWSAWVLGALVSGALIAFAIGRRRRWSSLRPLSGPLLLLPGMVACAGAPSGSATYEWTAAEQARYLGPAQAAIRRSAGSATGTRGAVTVAYNAYAARAGLHVLQQGGNAMDAALTTAVTQVATTAGSPVSYFGIMSLVYYDAKSKSVHTLWAGWNTLRGETAPLTIPGGVTLGDGAEPLGTVPSGRTALVGGFMRGVEAAHQRFGRRPFATLFAPAIRVADQGMPVHATLAHQFELRAKDLARLPATRAALLKPDGSAWKVGDTLRQPALAATLRRVAAEGADYMYKGDWARKLVAAVQADGGSMTLEDLSAYRAIWGDAVRARAGDYELAVPGAPNQGGTALIEAQYLARAAGFPQLGHWTTSGEALRRLSLASMGYVIDFLPTGALESAMPGVSFSPEARRTPENAAKLWAAMESGRFPVTIARQAPKHSDDVVVVDGEGNMVAITHSINSVYWGRTAINVDGISIGDPASFQQAAVARAGPGTPLPDPMETGIAFKGGVPVLAFASMGSGLHQRTLQGLLNVMEFGMPVDRAIDTADFFFPMMSTRDSGFVLPVPEGRFAAAVLSASGLKYREVANEQARLFGEGVWVAISRDPATGRLHAASHNRNNSAALAW